MDTSAHQEEYDRVIKRIGKLEDEEDSADPEMKKLLRKELIELRQDKNRLWNILHPSGTVTQRFFNCIVF